MATIRKRNGKYQVQVRRQGCAPISKTFLKLDDAKAWGRLTELEADQVGPPVDPRVQAETTVATILERYRDEIVVKKRGHEVETLIVNALLRQPWCKRSSIKYGSVMGAFTGCRLGLRLGFQQKDLRQLMVREREVATFGTPVRQADSASGQVHSRTLCNKRMSAQKRETCLYVVRRRTPTGDKTDSHAPLILRFMITEQGRRLGLYPVTVSPDVLHHFCVDQGKQYITLHR